MMANLAVGQKGWSASGPSRGVLVLSVLREGIAFGLAVVVDPGGAVEAVGGQAADAGHVRCVCQVHCPRRGKGCGATGLGSAD
jgi:hypothetical protein